MRHLFCGSLCALVLAAMPAHASLINGSFESPVIDGFNVSNITGWTGPTFHLNPYGVTDQPQLPPLVHGTQAAYVNNFGQTSGSPTTHGISQQLSDVLQANYTYTFSAWFGRRNDNAASFGTIQLWAGGLATDGVVSGGTLLATQNISLIQGQFVQGAVSYSPLPGDVLLGQQISVRLVGTPVANGFAQTNFDDAQFAVVVPLPGPAMLTLVGLGGLLVVRPNRPGIARNR